ncbi:MAG: hypothetical protein ACRD9Y_21085, partial [Blastocatellia bacterium]
IEPRATDALLHGFFDPYHTSWDQSWQGATVAENILRGVRWMRIVLARLLLESIRHDHKHEPMALLRDSSEVICVLKYRPAWSMMPVVVNHSIFH